MFDFNLPIDRSESDSVKWRKYKGRDIIPMWVADMDFKSPPEVIEALRRRIDHGVFGYAEAREDVIETVIDYLRRAYGWIVEPNWIVWLPGLVTGLNVACRAVGKPGGIVATTVPVYPPFLTAPRFSGRQVRSVMMTRGPQGWQIDFDALGAALDADCDMFILCNPHNPTGRCFEKTELLRLAELCLRHDIVICSDEIHCDLILAPGCRHVPIASLSAEIQARTITLMAPSKTYNIPGLGCGFAVIADDSLRRCFTQAMSGIVPHVNALGYTAARAAYSQGQGWLSAVLDYLRANRDLVAACIEKMPGLRTTPVEATYLAWIEARSIGNGNPAAFFDQAGVGLSDGADFGLPGFVRLNFGCPRSRLSEALQRMQSALSQSLPEGR